MHARTIGRWLGFAVLALSASTQAAEEPVKPKAVDPAAVFEARTHRGAGAPAGELAYRLFVPPDYDAKADTLYPLVLFLHGAGERGVDNKAQLKWGGRELATDLQAAGKCIVIAPQCPPGKQWVDTPWSKGVYSVEKVPVSESLRMAIEVVEKTAAEMKVDRSRIYVTGLSMGGYGTWDALARRPDLFAAGVAICGAGDVASAAKLTKAGVAVWAFHGDKDNVVPPAGSRDMAAAFKQAGAAEPQFKYTELAGVSHNAWSPAWKTPGLWTWLMSQKKSR
jgi:predicted peptidase